MLILQRKQRLKFHFVIEDNGHPRNLPLCGIPGPSWQCRIDLNPRADEICKRCLKRAESAINKLEK